MAVSKFCTWLPVNITMFLPPHNAFWSASSILNWEIWVRKTSNISSEYKPPQLYGFCHLYPVFLTVIFDLQPVPLAGGSPNKGHSRGMHGPQGSHCPTSQSRGHATSHLRGKWNLTDISYINKNNTVEKNTIFIPCFKTLMVGKFVKEKHN